MRCRAAIRHLSALLDGELGTRRAEALRGHLSECDACFERYEQLRRLSRATLATRAPSPEGLEDRILGVLARETARAPAVPATRRPALAWGALATVAVVAVAGALVFREWSTGRTPVLRNAGLPEDRAAAPPAGPDVRDAVGETGKPTIAAPSEGRSEANETTENRETGSTLRAVEPGAPPASRKNDDGAPEVPAKRAEKQATDPSRDADEARLAPAAAEPTGEPAVTEVAAPSGKAPTGPSADARQDAPAARQAPEVAGFAARDREADAGPAEGTTLLAVCERSAVAPPADDEVLGCTDSGHAVRIVLLEPLPDGRKSRAQESVLREATFEGAGLVGPVPVPATAAGRVVEATLRIDIDRGGRVTTVAIVDAGSAETVTEALLRAVGRWRFLPPPPPTVQGDTGGREPVSAALFVRVRLEPAP